MGWKTLGKNPNKEETMKKNRKYKQSTDYAELMSCNASLGDMRTDIGGVTELIRGIYVSTDSVPRRLVGVCGSTYNTYQYSDVDAHAVNALEMAGAGKWERSSYMMNDGESMRLRYEVLNPEWNKVNQKVGDEFSVGLEFSTGHRGYLAPQSIICSGFITRLACLNGMRSTDHMFRKAVKHFNREKVDVELVEDINKIVRNLGKMVDWFVGLHDVPCDRQQGVNVLKNISIQPTVRKNIINVWNQPHTWRGVENAYDKSSRHLGNLLNVTTQVTTHQHSEKNVNQADIVSSRVFDTLVQMAREPEAEDSFFRQMVKPVERKRRVREDKQEMPYYLPLPHSG